MFINFERLNILALDYGKTRIGYAVGDTNLGIAFGRDVIQNKSFESVLHSLQKIITEEKIDLILIGLPKMLNGQDSDQTEYTQNFGARLKENLEIEVLFEDERLTSAEATKNLQLQEIKEKKQKGKKDVISAEIILQNYLDRQ